VFLGTQNILQRIVCFLSQASALHLSQQLGPQKDIPPQLLFTENLGNLAMQCTPSSPQKILIQKKNAI